MDQPNETFECEVVNINDKSVEVTTVSSGGEEGIAWLDLADVDPWRRNLGEKFRIEVYVDAGISKFVWHTPAKLPLLHRRHFRDYVYPVMWAIALGMLLGEACSGHWSGCEPYALAGVAACLLGMYLARRQPRRTLNPNLKIVSSDD